jgi:hypothetical protein
MKKTALWVAILTACAICVAAQASATDGPGSSGAGYLLLPIGPRAIAMGEARTAITGDPFDWTVNPAALQTLGRNSISAFHSEWIMEARYDYLGGTYRVNEWLSVAGGFIYQYNEDIQGYDELGIETELLKNYNYQGIIGLGFAPATSFSAGFNLKYFGETLSEWSASGFGIDVGARYEILPINTAIGVAVQNIGPDVKFIETKESLPMTIRGGAAWTLELPENNVAVTFALDAVKPRFEKLYVNAGCEVSIIGQIFVRGGWSGQEYRAGDGFAFGAGVKVADAVTFDYSSALYGDLGTFHMISVHVGLR